MEKSKFLDEVKKRGYEASIDGGVVMIKYPGKTETGIKEIRAVAEKLDYNQSWGLRVVSADSVAAPKNNSDISEDSFNESETETSDDETALTETVQKSSDDDFRNVSSLDDDFLDDDDDILSDIDSFKQISLFDID